MELKGLKTKTIGRNVIYYKVIDSTQLEAWRLKDISSGSIIITDRQISGKGTHGRAWQKKHDKDIAFSIKIDLDCDVSKLSNITLDIAKIIVNEFQDLYNIKLDIKIPNDITVNNKKVGGILTETKTIGNTVKEMVIGIGINLCKQEFDQDLKDIATSIENEENVEIDRLEIITEFCNRFEKLILEIY